MAYRPDYGNYLIHLIRRTSKRSSFEILQKILDDALIRANSNKIKGKYKVICFTDSSLYNLARSLENIRLTSDLKYPPYDFYGVGFQKDLLFDYGARPVIYQPLGDFDILPDKLRYLHQTHDPLDNISWLWEREWRLHKDELPLCEELYPIILVRTWDEARILYEKFYKDQRDFLSNSTHYGEPFEINIFPFPVISLEYLTS